MLESESRDEWGLVNGGVGCVRLWMRWRREEEKREGENDKS